MDHFSSPEINEKIIFSFAACGWLKIYYFGVAKALQESGWTEHAVFTGSSSGSLVAAALVLQLDFEQVPVVFIVDHDPLMTVLPAFRSRNSSSLVYEGPAQV